MLPPVLGPAYVSERRSLLDRLWSKCGWFTVLSFGPKPIWHTHGTSRDRVADGSFLAEGTTNLWICDASVLAGSDGTGFRSEPTATLAAMGSALARSLAGEHDNTM